MVMQRKSLWIGLLLLAVVCLPAVAFSESLTVFQHKLQVSVDPEKGLLRVEDRLSQSDGGDQLSFALAEDFRVTLQGKRLKPKRSDGDLAYYKIDLDAPGAPVTLHYEGKIASTDQCDWLRQSCRLLNGRGLYLDTGSFWYPLAPGVMHTFELSFQGPKSWESLSQGERLASHQWKEQQPQDDIYLLAGPFAVYESEAEGRSAMVYLQKPDQKLADTYLKATHRYLDQYSDLIGQYPYSKFATVESFWETGWGMPSFTLLGPKVLRLPFIPHTSLPHEILHNWWGNSVYIDYQSGNWAEGLTAYMADHHSRELRGSDKGYRRDALQKYALFAQGDKDFPLSEFRSRHNNTTQAVGYSKALMLFHQLRQQLGDENFYAGLSHFFEENRFTTAGYAELQNSFESVTGEELGDYFQQWTQRAGAPSLRIEDVQQSDGTLKLILSQLPKQEPFRLEVPIALTLASGETTQRLVSMSKASETFSLDVAGAVSKIEVDPDFDLIRFPDPAELPVSLNSRFGDGKVTVLAQHSGEAAVAKQLEKLRAGLRRSGVRMKVIGSHEDLPRKGTVITLNPKDAILDQIRERFENMPIRGRVLGIQEQVFDRSSHSSAFALSTDDSTVIVLDAPDAESLSVLLRKMPHYGKYSYIVFDAQSGRNVLKGQWVIENSPLVRRLN